MFMVKIQCLVYNHERYLRQCLDGFVMQQTNFRFQAIVHDDASTDKSAEIIKEYADKYPDIIMPIFQTENQYSKKDGSLRRIMYEACKGSKYIAMCEGDDYWIDPLKLQKQVDFLEANPEYVVCGTKRVTVDKKGEQIHSPSLPTDGMLFTQCVVFRNVLNDIDTTNYFILNNDDFLFYRLSQFGKSKILDFCSSAYRFSNEGVWSSLTEEEKYRNFVSSKRAMYNFFIDNKIYEVASRVKQGELDMMYYYIQSIKNNRSKKIKASYEYLKAIVKNIRNPRICRPYQLKRILYIIFNVKEYLYL